MRSSLSSPPRIVEAAFDGDSASIDDKSNTLFIFPGSSNLYVRLANNCKYSNFMRSDINTRPFQSAVDAIKEHHSPHLYNRQSFQISNRRVARRRVPLWPGRAIAKWPVDMILLRAKSFGPPLPAWAPKSVDTDLGGIP